MAREHTDRHYDAELRRVREELLGMGARVEALLRDAMQALVERDAARAREVIAGDDSVDELEIAIDEQCTRILARRQPVASDLRFLAAALKLVTDLERIGDLAVNVAERVLELHDQPSFQSHADLVRMADIALEMLREALAAFLAQDAERARRVIARDDELDAFYAQVVRVLLTFMMENPKSIYPATRIQSIAKYLERVGDHATNLAEEVVFMVKGKDIRHPHTAKDSHGKG